ncbi:hypothetical protein LCGC14_2207800 [marine sediment metagenome]|uniref:Apea-like HEPN domain-containing protein n=1 Tax=marine sediment metagenome TaxID=412755 RepID=A0A0F9DEW0_9ZZZZ
MSRREIFLNRDEGEEALEVINHYINNKEAYPDYYYDFFLHWSLINPLYNAWSRNKKEVCRVIDFGKKIRHLWNNNIESFSKKLVALDCVGKGRNSAQPNKYVRLATLYLRKEFQLNSNICSNCKKKDYCKQDGKNNFHKLDAIMRILYQIRCNLFHGDKPELMGSQGERNKELVYIGNEILSNILQQLTQKF